MIVYLLLDSVVTLRDQCQFSIEAKLHQIVVKLQLRDLEGKCDEFSNLSDHLLFDSFERKTFCCLEFDQTDEVDEKLHKTQRFSNGELLSLIPADAGPEL